MKVKESLFIVMPAYNEEANISSVVRQWYPILEGKGKESRLVIADSGSSDRTHEILVDLQKEFDRLEILTDSDRQHGPKVIALYDYAIQKGADYVFQTDSDGQTNPDEFDAFWQLRTEYDGIFGYRNVRGDGKQRALVEQVVCLLLKIYFGVKVPDANAPFRLMKTDVIKKYLYKLPSDYNIPNIMITTYFAYYKEKMTFKTISFKPRQGGVNSVNIPRIVRIGWKALGDFRMLKKGMTNGKEEQFAG
ncbi:MAG: glycosyltransferase family 2 protein [Lachnospiraceae bacterium]